MDEPAGQRVTVPLREADDEVDHAVDWCPALGGIAAVIVVRTSPGLTSKTDTPEPASAASIESVRRINPAFAAA